MGVLRYNKFDYLLLITSLIKILSLKFYLVFHLFRIVLK